MILCATCKKVKDYGNGWVFCPHRGKWLHNGYSQCKGHDEGEPVNVQTPGTWSWIERVKASIFPNEERAEL